MNAADAENYSDNGAHNMTAEERAEGIEGVLPEPSGGNHIADDFEEEDPLDDYMQDRDYSTFEEERRALAGTDANGASELLEALSNLPQAREVILPVIMRKGDTLAALGDAVFNPETNKMVVSFNTEAGRSIAEFIGSGMLAAISFTGHMPRNEATNKLN